MGSLFKENIMDCTLFEWRQNDDEIYGILARKIMDKMKNKNSLPEQVMSGKRLSSPSILSEFPNT